MSDLAPPAGPRATVGLMPRLPRHLRGPALVALCAAVACLCAAASAWAQDAAVATDPVAAALPPGSPWWAGALVSVLAGIGFAAKWAAGLVERRLTADDAARAEYRKGIEARVAKLEDAAADTRTQLALTRQALAHVRDTLREAADD